jgi:hypothetical protein
MFLGYQQIGKICANGILRCIVSIYSVYTYFTGNNLFNPHVSVISEVERNSFSLAHAWSSLSNPPVKYEAVR